LAAEKSRVAYCHRRMWRMDTDKIRLSTHWRFWNVVLQKTTEDFLNTEENKHSGKQTNGFWKQLMKKSNYCIA